MPSSSRPDGAGCAGSRRRRRRGAPRRRRPSSSAAGVVEPARSSAMGARPWRRPSAPSPSRGRRPARPRGPPPARASTRRPTRPAAPVTTTVVIACAVGSSHPPAYHALVSDPGPGDDPFQGVPFLGDLARMLQGQGPLNWDAARQFALMIATEGKSEPNVDPGVRFQYQELGRIADLHVAAGHRPRHRRRRAAPSRSSRSRRARGPSAPSTPTARCSSTWPARSGGHRRRAAGADLDEQRRRAWPCSATSCRCSRR